ncbi:hypothetical protein DPMN_069999 [Dreissena polymorpha]|uniref:Uncharacterized protein n=1 Tax=Dreissena polymorpha TaxID=45954 RepID=A0A9D3Z4L3_DREPO|nr:hypothetical protein DPMN_069999 [Dreissena polymorpha]
MILDGAVLVNMHKPTGCLTFNDYAENVFVPYWERTSGNINRVDVVWDVYIAHSLKESTRSTRGKGVRRRVLPDSRIPKKLGVFSQNIENKTELFEYLADKRTESSPERMQILSTKGQEIVSNQQYELINTLAPCSHEDADTRAILRVSDAASHGLRKVMIRTVDTDVVVLAVAFFHK